MNNKHKLVSIIAEDLNISKIDAGIRISKIFEAITEFLVNDENVRISGFGKFEVIVRAEKKGRNPKTGEAITIPSVKTPVFRPSKSLIDKIN